MIGGLEQVTVPSSHQAIRSTVRQVSAFGAFWKAYDQAAESSNQPATAGQTISRTTRPCRLPRDVREKTTEKKWVSPDGLAYLQGVLGS